MEMYDEIVVNFLGNNVYQTKSFDRILTRYNIDSEGYLKYIFYGKGLCNLEQIVSQTIYFYSIDEDYKAVIENNRMVELMKYEYDSDLDFWMWKSVDLQYLVP